MIKQSLSRRHVPITKKARKVPTQMRGYVQVNQDLSCSKVVTVQSFLQTFIRLEVLFCFFVKG